MKGARRGGESVREAGEGETSNRESKRESGLMAGSGIP